MPNHIHAIIVIIGTPTIVGAPPCGRPDSNNEGQAQEPGDDGQSRGLAPTGDKTLSLADVVHRFKTMTTKRYTDGVKQNGWPVFSGRLWQRNYYEHVIRDEDDLNRIRQYICDNPVCWAEDENNPDNIAMQTDEGPVSRQSLQ